MATPTAKTPRPTTEDVAPATPRRDTPRLENGDRLSRAEFERRYEAMPALKKAELIEGVVYVPSPVRLSEHSVPHARILTWLGIYSARTPWVGIGDNPTLRMDLDNEPQPDAFLRIHERKGGASRRDADGYLAGAPELIAEVAASSASYDLGTKKHAYRRNGVREYIVWRVMDLVIDWFVLVEGVFRPIDRDPAGLAKSVAFPGLWLDPQALVDDDMTRVLAVLDQGLATPEHAAFASRLAALP